jgi:hypothetical protein
MNPNQALWEKGDFTAIASFMRHSGQNLVDSLGITSPLQILDLGCGDGTKLEALSDNTFDLSLSIFGTMLLPNPSTSQKNSSASPNQAAKS